MSKLQVQMFILSHRLEVVENMQITLSSMINQINCIAPMCTCVHARSAMLNFQPG